MPKTILKRHPLQLLPSFKFWIIFLNTRKRKFAVTWRARWGGKGGLLTKLQGSLDGGARRAAGGERLFPPTKSFLCVYSQLLSCVLLFDPMDCSLRGSSVHGIFQASILEWVAISSSRDPAYGPLVWSCLLICKKRLHCKCHFS